MENKAASHNQSVYNELGQPEIEQTVILLRRLRHWREESFHIHPKKPPFSALQDYEAILIDSQ
jgi:hypothetical protein